MREAPRLQSGLFGFGVVIASSTLIWQGITHTRQFFKVQHEMSKVSSTGTCPSCARHCIGCLHNVPPSPGWSGLVSAWAACHTIIKMPLA